MKKDCSNCRFNQVGDDVQPCCSCGGLVPENWMVKRKVENEDYTEDWEKDDE